MLLSRVLVLICVGVAAWAPSASAQSCPSEFSSCDNGGCCLSSEQCCPTAVQGCCSSAAPYCCGDGTCAVAPSACNSGLVTPCEGYEVPCGEGCAPAGADCCDGAGHYCGATSMCSSETTCISGDVTSLARLVVGRTDMEREPALLPPFRDPSNASSRSCALDARGAASTARWALVSLLIGLALRRRRGLRVIV